MGDGTTAKAIPPPNGFLKGRVDDKGRLKLPAELKEYLLASGAKRVFITTLDMASVRIYTPSGWEDNKNLLASFQDDPAAADDVLFVANHYGADSDMDENGRVLLPQELRVSLSLENQPVFLECMPDAVNVYGEAAYEERKRRAVQGLAEKVLKLRQKGLK